MFVVPCLGAITARTSGHKVYILGSDDQGQNWDGPVRVNPDDPTLPEVFYDVDEMWAAGSGGLCHIVWENDYLLQTAEDGFYASYSMSNGTLQVGVPRVRITPNGADVDTS